MKSLVFAISIIAMSLVGQNVNAQSKDSKTAATHAFADNSITLPVSYEFDKSVKMELVSTSKDPEENSQMVYVMRYHDSNNYIGMTPAEVDGVVPDPQADVIIDFERMHMITFMVAEESKMAFVYPIPESQMATEDNTKDVVFKKTGEEKEVLGYTCFEHTFKSAEASGTVWAAPDLDMNLVKSFEALGLQLEMGDDGVGNGINGFIIEFDLTNKSTGEHTRMHVVEVELDDSHQLQTTGFVPTYMAPAVEETK